MHARTIRSLVVVFVALLAGMLAGVVSQPSVAYADDTPVKVTVRVTDGGFDPNVIEVDQGKSIELTFVWANVAHPDDEHIITVPGYKLESDKIDSKHLESTVKFIATQSGTFSFKCDIECDSHANLQHGELRVKPSSGGTTAVLQPSKLVVDSATGVVVRGGTVTVSAVLQDNDGNPISKAQVQFYAQQEFLGHSGLVAIGAATTQADGTAVLAYQPTSGVASTIVAKFPGVGLYDATEKTIPLAASDQFAPRVVPPPDDNLHGIKGGAHLGLLLVIGGVWLTFGWIVFQAFGIRHSRGEE